MKFNINAVRQQFPALDSQAIFFDNPGGTQIAKPALDRLISYLTQTNANHGGAFQTSIASDAVVAEARLAAAEFINAKRAEEIIFGSNMTSLTLHISRSLAQTWQPGDSILVTRLDHDANVTPWVLAAQDRGCAVEFVDFDLDQGTLDLQGLTRQLEKQPRLVAVGYSSNALGTINPVREICAQAHAVGAMVYVDAVHYAPHGPIDVQDLGCDFLVCSAYKFFGPHLGILYGRFDLLDQLQAYKVRPASNMPPEKFETGTQNFEGIAGLLGALEYFEWLAEFNASDRAPETQTNRQQRYKQAMRDIRAYESSLSLHLLEVLEETPGVTIYGLRDASRLNERVPTFAFTLQGYSPRRVAEELGKRGIYVWDGNYYAISVTESLGLEESGGMVRVGPVHYNTVEEIQRFGKVLGEIVDI